MYQYHHNLPTCAAVFGPIHSASCLPSDTDIWAAGGIDHTGNNGHNNAFRTPRWRKIKIQNILWGIEQRNFSQFHKSLLQKSMANQDKRGVDCDSYRIPPPSTYRSGVSSRGRSCCPRTFSGYAGSHRMASRTGIIVTHSILFERNSQYFSQSLWREPCCESWQKI